MALSLTISMAQAQIGPMGGDPLGGEGWTPASAVTANSSTRDTPPTNPNLSIVHVQEPHNEAAVRSAAEQVVGIYVDRNYPGNENATARQTIKNNLTSDIVAFLRALAAPNRPATLRAAFLGPHAPGKVRVVIQLTTRTGKKVWVNVYPTGDRRPNTQRYHVKVAVRGQDGQIVHRQKYHNTTLQDVATQLGSILS
jgi:hypothetical protein